MCGIVGYAGIRAACPILLTELKCLEYRGYDSAGVAVLADDGLRIFKCSGKLDNLACKLKAENPEGQVGIGHTRWATHGIPSEDNAHPHTDNDGRIAVVHNGIIENHDAIREELAGAGHNFISETDTEVVAHLIGLEYRARRDMIEALKTVVGKLQGAYALSVLNYDEPDRLYAVNHHYSLAVGLGDGETFLASDTTAVRQYTNKIVRLEESEIAEICAAGARFFTFSGAQVVRQPEISSCEMSVADKAGFKHYMLKEINEQPYVVRKTLNKYLGSPSRQVNFLGPTRDNRYDGAAAYGVRLSDEEIDRIKRISIVACGSAFYSGLVGEHIIEELCGIPVQTDVASEFHTRRVLVDRDTLAIAVSQSGETADTLAAVKAALAQGALTLGITNRADSHLSRLIPNLIVTECGMEVSVPATKTFAVQLLSFYLLAFYLAEKRGVMDSARALKLKKALFGVPALQEQILSRSGEIRKKALKYAKASDMVFLARGVNVPVAMEGALKLKELSYIHASGYPAGELKHGPIAVLDSDVPVVAIVVPGRCYDKTLSNIEEAKARNAQVIAVAVDGDRKVERLFDTVLWVPPVDELLSPLLTVLPLQLFAYYIADYLGKDVDQPRNLAKSVTVE